MRGYRIDLTCPRCGGDVEPVTEGLPFAGTEVSAICRCTECRKEFQVHVMLRPVAAHNAVVCGTDSGYQRHVRAHTVACDPCLRAHSEYVQIHKPLVGVS